MLRIYKEPDHQSTLPPSHNTTHSVQPTPSFQAPGNKISFISLGCPRNLVDSEVMLGILLQSGYEHAPDHKEADVVVINTCGFLEASRQESCDTIKTALTDSKTGARVVVTGCMVQTHETMLRDLFPQVHCFLGSGDVEGILKAVETDHTGSLVTSARSYLESGEVPRQLSTPKHYAYLKIAEGCRKRCAYCRIPVIKGPLKSKPQEQVLKEFRLLLDRGVKEIILIAQDLGDYGKDRGGKNSTELVALLREMLKDERSFWIRLLYLYPDEITSDLIDLMKLDQRICPYLDMPIQHIDNQILKQMHRSTSKEQIISILTQLRTAIPRMSIRTSLIVGFPGETDAQFESLKEFLTQHPIDQVGVFKFSREPGSVAYDLPGQVAEEVKQARYDELMKLQQQLSLKRAQRLIGKKYICFVEGYHPESNLLMIARHSGQCPEIDNHVLINDGRKVKAFGEPYLVEITGVAGYDLVGRVLSKASRLI